MEDEVLAHGVWKKESIREVICAFGNFIGAKLSWGQFLTGVRSRNVLRTKPYFLPGVENMWQGFTSFEGQFYCTFFHSECSFCFFTGVTELL